MFENRALRNIFGPTNDEVNDLGRYVKRLCDLYRSHSEVWGL